MKEIVGKVRLSEWVLIISLLAMALPYGYTFTLLFIPVIFLKSLKFRHLNFRINIELFLYLIMVINFVFGMLITKKLLFEGIKIDLINMLYGLVFLYILGTSDGIKRLHSLETCKKIVNIQFIIAIMSLVKYVGVKFRLFSISSNVVGKWGTSLRNDYNMFAFVFCIGIICAINIIRRSQNFEKTRYYICLAIFLLVIGLSGSRRAILWVILLGVLMVLPSVKRFLVLTLKGKKVIVFILLLLFMVIKILHSDLNINEVFRDAIYRISNLSLELQGNKIGSRLGYFIFGLKLLSQYSVTELIVGSGFDYVKDFAIYSSSEYFIDYPHNFLLASMLYSGMVGFATHIFYLASVGIKLLNQSVLNKMFYISIYVTSLWFFLFSGNTIFSFQLLVLFLLYGSVMKNKKQVVRIGNEK